MSASMNSSSSENKTELTYNFDSSGGPTASIDGSVGSGASGNVAFNNAAGAFNHQSNAALISTSLADSTAVIGISQTVGPLANVLVANSTASIGGSAFSKASGNVSVNNAAGALNQQSNALIIH